jgi:PadR family transcriptional regulator PadR
MGSRSTLGEFEHVVLLTVVRLADEASGPGIARELEATAGRSVSRGALYTTLDRLERKGLLHWRVAPGGEAREDVPRRLYAATATGLAALREAREVLQRLWRGVSLKGRP